MVWVVGSTAATHDLLWYVGSTFGASNQLAGDVTDFLGSASATVAFTPPPLTLVQLYAPYQAGALCGLDVVGATGEFQVIWSPTNNPLDAAAVELPITSANIVDGAGRVFVTAQRTVVRYGQTGWLFVRQDPEVSGLETTLLAEPNRRITTEPDDLVAGDIIEWRNVVGGGDSSVTIYSNGTPEATESVTSFEVRVHDGIEWSPWVVQPVGDPVFTNQGFLPETGYTVTGGFTEGGTITLTDASNGFGATGPTLLYYDDYSTVEAGSSALPAGQLGVGYSTGGGGPKPVHAVPAMPYGRGLVIGSTGSTQNASAGSGRLYLRPTDNQPYSEFYEFKVSHWPEAHIANSQPYLDGTNTWQVKGIWHYFNSGFNTTDNDIFVASGAPSWSAGNLYWVNVQITGSNDPPISTGSTNGYTVQTTAAPERAPIPGPRATEAWFKAAPFGQQPVGSDGMFRQTDTTLGLQVNMDYADVGYFTADSAPNNQWDRCTLTGFERGFLVDHQCNIYYGQVYIAIGPGCPARVVIADSADYDAALKLSICTIDSWSAGTVTAKIRTGFFHLEGLAGKHLHVFDANNNGRYLGEFTV